MGQFSDRQDFFKTLCIQHKIVHHDYNGRRSFITINDEEELGSAVTNKLDLPCVVQLAYSGSLVDKGGSIRRVIYNSLWFLDKGSMSENEPFATVVNKLAYDRAELVMNDFIAYMLAEFETNFNCGVFLELDLERFSWTMAGPILDNLYGWKLTWSDEVDASDITNFDITSWEAYPDGSGNNGGGNNGGGDNNGGGAGGAKGDIIPFVNVDEIEIPITDRIKSLYGPKPMLQVWFVEDGKPVLANIPVEADADPPTKYIVSLTGLATGFVVIK